MRYSIDVKVTTIYREISVEANSLEEAKQVAIEALDSGEIDIDEINYHAQQTLSGKGHIVRLDTGAEITLNADYTNTPSKCKSCGALIFWGKTKNDKFMPLNPDLKTSHYSTCPNATQHRKK